MPHRHHDLVPDPRTHHTFTHEHTHPSPRTHSASPGPRSSCIRICCWLGHGRRPPCRNSDPASGATQVPMFANVAGMVPRSACGEEAFACREWWVWGRDDDNVQSGPASRRRPSSSRSKRCPFNGLTRSMTRSTPMGAQLLWISSTMSPGTSVLKTI